MISSLLVLTSCGSIKSKPDMDRTMVIPCPREVVNNKIYVEYRKGAYRDFNIGFMKYRLEFVDNDRTAELRGNVVGNIEGELMPIITNNQTGEKFYPNKYSVGKFYAITISSSTDVISEPMGSHRDDSGINFFVDFCVEDGA